MLLMRHSSLASRIALNILLKSGTGRYPIAFKFFPVRAGLIFLNLRRLEVENMIIIPLNYGKDVSYLQQVY